MTLIGVTRCLVFSKVVEIYFCGSTVPIMQPLGLHTVCGLIKMKDRNKLSPPNRQAGTDRVATRNNRIRTVYKQDEIKDPISKLDEIECTKVAGNNLHVWPLSTTVLWPLPSLLPPIVNASVKAWHYLHSEMSVEAMLTSLPTAILHTSQIWEGKGLVLECVVEGG